MGALNLAKDCYRMKIELLGNDNAIKHFVDFVGRHKSNAQEQAFAEALELERRKRERVFWFNLNSNLKSKAKAKSQDEIELDAIRKKLRESKRQYKALRAAEEAAGIDLESRRRENKEQAAKMGLTLTEYGLLKYASLEAELSAKVDETLEETAARVIS